MFSRLAPENENAINAMGHRDWVGGLWDEMGKLQFDFLIEHGLQPKHILLDIACGSLRSGRLLIPYLNPGNYLGIERHKVVVDAGLREEIESAIVKERRPEFVISSGFEFSRFSKQPSICIAQSLFSHLNPAAIRLCLSNLRAFAKSPCVLYATFFEARWPRPYFLVPSHSHRSFRYTKSQMMRFGAKSGWQSRYIGDWKHPRGQRMMEYRI